MGSFNLFQHLKKNRYKKVRTNVGIGWIDYLFIWSCLISVKSGEIIMDSKYTIVISIFAQTHIRIIRLVLQFYQKDHDWVWRRTLFQDCIHSFISFINVRVVSRYVALPVFEKVTPRYKISLTISILFPLNVKWIVQDYVIQHKFN